VLNVKVHNLGKHLKPIIMSALEKFDFIIEKIDHFKSVIEFFLLPIGITGYKIKQEIMVYIVLSIFVLLIVISIVHLIRIWVKQNDEMSYIRTFLNSDNWKETKKDINHRLISITGNKDKPKIRKEMMLNNVVLYVLENKRNLTYNKVNSILCKLITEDNLSDFKE
jgi:hypothetical protein